MAENAPMTNGSQGSQMSIDKPMNTLNDQLDFLLAQFKAATLEDKQRIKAQIISQFANSVDDILKIIANQEGATTRARYAELKTELDNVMQSGGSRKSKKAPAKPKSGRKMRGGNGATPVSQENPAASQAMQAINDAIAQATSDATAAASTPATGGSRSRRTSSAKTGGSSKTLGDLLSAFNGGGRMQMGVISSIANSAPTNANASSTSANAGSTTGGAWGSKKGAKKAEKPAKKAPKKK